MEGIRSPHNYDRQAVSVATGLVCPREESKTQQQFKDESDINTIVERFGLTGELPTVNRMPVSGDFTGVTDFQTAMQLVRKAQEGFMEFPAQLRARFANDPQRVLQFLEDEKNRDEAIRLGLVPKPQDPPRTPLQAIDELARVLTPSEAAKAS